MFLNKSSDTKEVQKINNRFPLHTEKISSSPSTPMLGVVYCSRKNVSAEELQAEIKLHLKSDSYNRQEHIGPQ